MGRPPTPPRNLLGIALRDRRGVLTGEQAADTLGIYRNTYYRLERGTHRPSADTALKLAHWLGWSMEQVMEAAKQGLESPQGQEDANNSKGDFHVQQSGEPGGSHRLS